MADLILHHAKIHTVDPKQPWAEAVAIAQGRIMAVGSHDDVLGLAGPNTRQMDLGGRVITPGLVDAHLHFQRFAESLMRTDL